MITPSYNEIKIYAKNYDLVPVCREIYADIITPITLLRKLSAVSNRFYLLESVEGGEKWGRYSFLGYDPLIRATCNEGVVTLEELYGKSRTIISAKPMEVLREIMSQHKAPRINGFPPFSGGFVGYFSYSLFSFSEPTLNIKRGSFHDYDVMLFDKIIAYDHFKQKIIIVANIKTDQLLENYSKAINDIDKIVELIKTQIIPELQAAKKPEFSCSVTKEEFCSIVEKTKEYIRDGEIFQAVISRQFNAEYEGSLINSYRVLRTTNPSPYMVFMKINDLEIMCSSPETLVRLNNGRLTTFPVAGSRPRGLTEEEDILLESELLHDEKELSEHNMLVDLGRNDLGKISEFNSVELKSYKMIRRFSKIMHICSQVEGDIRTGEDGFSAIEAVLPAGTLSGAPKIRACEIINKLENRPRGIYGGALGYIDFSGNMDTCIAIRMAVKQNGRVYVQAGGGIVADSIPELEYYETENKAAAIINAIIKSVEEGL